MPTILLACYPLLRSTSIWIVTKVPLAQKRSKTKVPDLVRRFLAGLAEISDYPRKQKVPRLRIKVFLDVPWLFQSEGDL